MANSNIEEYKKRAQETPTTSTEDYYQMAKDQEYNLLLDKEVALENAKNNAVKHTNAQVAAQGLSGTGYGSSLNAGIHSDYINALNSAQADYGNAMRDISLKEKEAQETQQAADVGKWNQLIYDATDMNSLNEYLSNSGFGTIDQNGDFSFGTKPENMSDEDWNTIRYLYGTKKTSLDYSSQGFSDYASFQGTTAEGEDAKTSKWGVANELRVIFSEDVMSKAQNGDAVKLVNGQNGKGMDYMYLIYRDGKWYVATVDQYQKAAHKGELKGVKNSQTKSLGYDDINWING